MNTPSPDAKASGRTEEAGKAFNAPFLLRQLRLHHKDKLHNVVQEILWCGKNYIIYRTCQGVFVHFADDAKNQARQRKAFNKICPELCELRFLTHEMQDTGKHWYSLWRVGRRSKEPGGGAGASLFEHNLAQAIMLLMEGDEPNARDIATAALTMAVTRSTNDNTIRYVKSSIVFALMAIVAIGISAAVAPAILPEGGSVSTYLLAALFGVLGAAFSVITRVRSFQMKPCQQSNMNYLMAWTRIGVGLIGGLMLYLAMGKLLGNAMINPALLRDWEVVAIIGFTGGFAERLVHTVFQRAASALEESSGTPVQAARKVGQTPKLPASAQAASSP